MKMKREKKTCFLWRIKIVPIVAGAGATGRVLLQISHILVKLDKNIQNSFYILFLSIKVPELERKGGGGGLGCERRKAHEN